MLATVPFTPPIGVPYCEAVRDALRAKLPTPKLEAYLRGSLERRDGKTGELHLVVEVRDGARIANVTLRVG